MKETISMPRVSVVMCTYNGENFLVEQIDSILKQTYPVYELIIQDDCSTDRTWEIIQRYARNYPMIRAMRNSRNLGFNQNFKDAMLKADGDYVAIADQDDIWYERKLEKQVQTIGNHDLCFSAYHRDQVFSENCRQVVLPAYNIERLMFVNCIPGHSMLMRRDFLHEESHWNAHICYDWWFLICAHFERGIACVPEPLNWHRPHAASAIATLRRQHAHRKSSQSIIHPYLYGYQDLKLLRKKKAWNIFYQLLWEKSAGPAFPLVHQLCDCLLKRKTFLLCWLCMKNRNLIYPDRLKSGIMGLVRGFFYPLIYAYNNTNFEL